MLDRPNVLLITADHMRWDALGCNGNPFVQTPNLDALAARGVTFDGSFSCNPICVPGRATITTGNYSHVCTGIKNNSGRIRSGQPTIAAHFRDAGYHTLAVGKLHYVPYAPPGQPRLLHGFEHAELCEEGRILHQFSPGADARGLEDYHDWLHDMGWGGYERAHGTGNNDVHPAPSPLPAELHEESWVATRTIANLEDHLSSRPGRPFFAWASFTKPHPPYDPPRPFDALYDPRDIPPPVGSVDLLADRDPWLRYNPVAYGWDKLSPQAVQVARAHYFGMVTFQDQMIGRILSFLSDTGLTDNTLVVYTADHGDLLGDFGCFFKCNMFDGSVRIPAIYAGPGVAPHATSGTQLVGQHDILPTLAELTGTSLRAPVMGSSLAPALRDPSAQSRELVFSQSLDSPRQRYMVRSHSFKYVYHELGGIEELYDCKDDPHELRNLATDRPELAAEYRAALVDWCRETGDAAMLDEAGDLRVSDEQLDRRDAFNPGNMGWRWY